MTRHLFSLEPTCLVTMGWNTWII